MREAIEAAQQTRNAARANTHTMASLIAGQLEDSNVSHSTLKKLKDELRRWNAHTNSWRPAK